jgi:hypothetical protein
LGNGNLDNGNRALSSLAAAACGGVTGQTRALKIRIGERLKSQHWHAPTTSENRQPICAISAQRRIPETFR